MALNCVQYFWKLWLHIYNIGNVCFKFKYSNSNLEINWKLFSTLSTSLSQPISHSRNLTHFWEILQSWHTFNGLIQCKDILKVMIDLSKPPSEPLSHSRNLTHFQILQSWQLKHFECLLQCKDILEVMISLKTPLRASLKMMDL